MKLSSLIAFAKGFFIVCMVLVLVYIAILFTGVGDTFVYKNTGHDITGKAKEAYHQEMVEKDKRLREKVASMPKTTISIDSAKFDFGKVKQGDKVEHTYKLTNTGTESLIISDVKVSCGCTLADYTQEPVPQGGVADVSIVFDSADKSGHTEKALHVYTNTEYTPTALAFSADIYVE